MESLYVKQILVGPMMNYSYLVGDKETNEAAIVDPGWEGKKLALLAEREGFKVTHILATHAHFDHANEVGTLVDLVDPELCVHDLESRDFSQFSKVKKLKDKDHFKVGNLDFEVLHTPGHTAGSICFKVNGLLFSGDTLFAGSIGRTDLEGGDAEEMFHSLMRLRQLPDSTIVYPGHEYGPRPTSTIGDEKKLNPYMRFTNVSDFLRMV